MWRKTIGAMAAIVLVAGLAANADDEQADREAAERERIADREAAEREKRADKEAAERERIADREANEREKRADQEAGEAERRRDREAGNRPRRRGDDAVRDEGPRRPPQPPRGPRGPEEMMQRMMPGGPGTGPRGMRGMIMPGMPGMQGMPGMGMPFDDERLRENDPEMFELEQNDRRLERESQELAEQYRRASDGPARDEIRGKLRDTVARHFKMRQQRRELEVKRIEAQLDRLRGSLERRSKDADAIIDRRMSQMLGESDADF